MKRAQHPGRHLHALLDKHGLSQSDLSDATDIDESRISEIINGRRDISAHWALLLGIALDSDPREWLRLQAEYDLQQFVDENPGFDRGIVVLI